jgi:hypothetical protein
MDRNQSLYFDELSKKSLSEIREVFENLKHIGMSDEDIDKYAKQYKEFFEKNVNTGYQHIDGGLQSKPCEADKVYNTSIPWRKELMEKNSPPDATYVATFSEVSKDQVLTDLSQSVVSQHSSS